jgi:hypothetical protein
MTNLNFKDKPFFETPCISKLSCNYIRVNYRLLQIPSQMTSFLRYQPDKPITKTLDAFSRPKKRILFSCQNIQECDYIPIDPLHMTSQCQ